MNGRILGSLIGAVGGLVFVLAGFTLLGFSFGGTLAGDAPRTVNREPGT